MFQQTFGKKQMNPKRQQSINAVKYQTNILEKRQKHWLIELNDYDKNIQQYIKTLNLAYYDEE